MALIISFALLVGLASLAVLLWALASGQYDDLDGDAVRILLDDEDSAEEDGPQDLPQTMVTPASPR